MSIAHPWIEARPRPTKQLPTDRLEERIQQLLSTNNMGVLSTIGTDGPIGSPIEFYAEGLALYMYPDPGTPKVKAIERDPRVCFSVFMPYVGWASARGCQMFCTAQLLEAEMPEWYHGMEIYRWQTASVELHREVVRPPAGRLLKLEPHRILYLEMWLSREGYAARQTWRNND